MSPRYDNLRLSGDGGGVSCGPLLAQLLSWDDGLIKPMEDIVTCI